MVGRLICGLGRLVRRSRGGPAMGLVVGKDSYLSQLVEFSLTARVSHDWTEESGWATPDTSKKSRSPKKVRASVSGWGCGTVAEFHLSNSNE